MRFDFGKVECAFQLKLRHSRVAFISRTLQLTALVPNHSQVMNASIRPFILLILIVAAFISHCLFLPGPSCVVRTLPEGNLLDIKPVSGDAPSHTSVQFQAI